MKHDVIIKQLDDKIQTVYQNNKQKPNTQLAKLLKTKHNLPQKLTYLRQVIGAWKKSKNSKQSIDKTPNKSNKQISEKTGFEIRDDYVINWSDKTIVTDLGHYGTYICSIDRHAMIQRKYVYDHGNETAAIVAMEFDFPHTKAVYVYARIHGFSKASTPQTDLEFELGKTVEESVEENIQTLKRKVYKSTQKRKWKETVEAADKWWNIEDSVLESIKALTLELQSDEPQQQLQYIIPPSDYKFSALIGISDMHYLKLCYDHTGNITYDRDIAKQRIKDHVQTLAQETSRYGRPERFFVIAGNDNIHVDGIHHSTTKGTLQHQATDGLWRLELKNYIKIQLELINYYKQIAPVTVIPVKGNHDYQTSIAIHNFIELYYEKDPDVTVTICHDTRAYIQYKDVCLVATHGDELGSIKKLEAQAHKLIMGEAKQQGINVMDVNHYLLIHGHEHVGSTRDLNGHVQRVGLPSLSDIDDFWHKEKGYVGRQPESLVIIIDPKKGRKAIMYASV